MKTEPVAQSTMEPRSFGDAMTAAQDGARTHDTTFFVTIDNDGKHWVWMGTGYIPAQDEIVAVVAPEDAHEDMGSEEIERPIRTHPRPCGGVIE